MTEYHGCRDANKVADIAGKKTRALSEDQAADLKGTMQRLMKKHENEIDSIISAKTKEIEEV